MKSHVHIITTFIVLACCDISNSLYPPFIKSMCPELYRHVFKGYVPRGNMSSGTFGLIETADTLAKCVYSCCKETKCNAIVIKDTSCYQIACVSNELCIPVRRPDGDNQKTVQMVLIRPLPDADTWPEVLRAPEEIDNRDIVSRLLNGDKYDINYDDDDDDDPLFADGSNYNKHLRRDCQVGIDGICGPNEECTEVSDSMGLCRCKIGYGTDGSGVCAKPSSSSYAGRETGYGNASTAKQPLTVTVESKQVQLPVNNVTLSAVASPEPTEGQKYQYDWQLLKQPEGTNTIKHQNAGQLLLEQLAEGLYTFKVTVSNTYAGGETFANVTVLSPTRINKPPTVVITPAAQTVKLPNTVAVLDASSTTDDAGIVSYHWELQQGPLGYQPHLIDSPTLQLKDLTNPGNYTFKLTVTDTDHATNYTTANITVLKITDYPPEANAGQDVILYLPHNKITLNGNLSSDDHAISTWEWTKSPSDGEKAADMQDTRTPYLRLSDLEKGMYTFVLKVTDSANQSGSSEVHVFVKPPTNRPPVADAGDNVTISLPDTWTVLDGTKSTDDNKIETYDWEQIDGPSKTTIISPNTTASNVTGLTRGNYLFKLTVTDDNGNKASDVVTVTVNQNKNQNPIANAGGDQEVELPRNAVYLNGSKSSDDLAIVKWQWTRKDTSLALGNVVEGTETGPVLILTNLYPGRFVFQLSVTDEQGMSDSDTVTIHAKIDPEFYHLVALTLNIDATKLSQEQFDIIKAKLALLIKDGTKLYVRGLDVEQSTSHAMLVFYVQTTDGKDVPANDVVRHLRSVDQGLLGYAVVGLKTVVCQNVCSGHGVCQETSRKCVCEAFWMQDLWRLYVGDGDSDCRWSVLYVVVALLVCLVIVVSACWALAWLCLNKKKLGRRPTPQTYSLIQQDIADEELPAHCFSSRNTISDSDTDSDVLFESRNKQNRQKNDNARNGHCKATKRSNNGFKMGRRVKT